MKLRNRLKHLRHQHEMNAKQFAAHLGLAYSHYVRLENQRIQPTIQTAWKIKTRLNISLDDLFEEINTQS